MVHLARCLGAAEHCWSAKSYAGTLCCGSAGQGYAILEAYNLSGDAKWLSRAQELAGHSAKFAGTPWMHTNSLYKGDVGTALLAADLTSPEMAAMPLFGSEKWPK